MVESASPALLTSLMLYQNSKSMLMQTQHFLLPLLQIKSITLAKHGVAFIVKQSQERHVIGRRG